MWRLSAITIVLGFYIVVPIAYGSHGADFDSPMSGHRAPSGETGEVGNLGVNLAKDVGESVINLQTYDDVIRVGHDGDNKFLERQVWNQHSADSTSASSWNIYADLIPPIGRHYALADASWHRDILERCLPDKIECGRLTAIEGVYSNEWVHEGRRDEINRCGININIGPNLRFADSAGSYAAAPSDPPQSDSRDCQNASKSDQRQICRGIASCLFPKPIIFLFFSGALLGGCIVAWAVIQGQCDENPDRKRDQTTNR